MDLRKIKKLIELVEESGITELEVKSGDETIRIGRGNPAPPGVTAPAPLAAGGDQICAPLAGTFYRAPAPGEAPFVAPGRAVTVGDVLCIIESMKMMNRIEAERAGTITAVLVADGEAVDAGRPLFGIE